MSRLATARWRIANREYMLLKHREYNNRPDIKKKRALYHKEYAKNNRLRLNEIQRRYYYRHRLLLRDIV